MTERPIDEALRLLSENDAHRRHSAVALLERSRSPLRIPALIGCMSDPDSQVRIMATFALRRLADPAALAALERGLREERNPVVRANCAASIARSPLGSAERIAPAPEDDDWHVRCMAIRAARDLGDRSLIPHARARLRDRAWWPDTWPAACLSTGRP